MSSGIDTTGNDTNFTENDAADVVAFQSHYGIRQTGYVGPMTRAKLNALYGCHNNQQSTQITWPTSPTVIIPPYMTGGVTYTAPAVPQPSITSLSWGPDLTYGTGKFIYTITGNNLSNIVAVREEHLVDGQTTYTNFVSKSNTQIVFGATTMAGHNTTDYYSSSITVVDNAGKVSNTMSIPVDYRNQTSTSAPIIDSFSINANQQFSLSAHNYSTVTFRSANCGMFVHVLRSADGTSLSYPTGNASLCNAEQYYSKSNTNSDPSVPPIYNEPLYLWNAQGTVDGQTSFISNGHGSNNSGSDTLIVNVCNTAGKCVQQSASFPIYAKG